MYIYIIYIYTYLCIYLLVVSVAMLSSWTITKSITSLHLKIVQFVKASHNVHTLCVKADNVYCCFSKLQMASSNKDMVHFPASLQLI